MWVGGWGWLKVALVGLVGLVDRWGITRYMDGLADTSKTGKQRKNRAKEFRGKAKKTGGASAKKK